jgi:hypothetical protein
VWAAAAALLIAIGTSAAVVGAHDVAANDAHTSRLTFHGSAAEIASNVKLAVQHYEDLELAAGAFVVDHTNPSEAQFRAFGRALKVGTLYPDLTSVGWIVEVPAADLTTFAHEADEDAVARGAFTVQPPGSRPYYCFAQVALNTVPMSAPPVGFDYCPGNSLLAARNSGRSTATATLLANGRTVLALVSPIYRGGGDPATESGRLRAFRGWSYMGILPSALLSAALKHHPGMMDALRRTASGSTFAFAAGTRPRRAAKVEVNLHDGSTLEIFGVIDRGGMFADGNALAVLLGGLTLCSLLAALLFALGTQRVRALRLVAEQTRELSEEAQRSALARDEAVEASNAKSVFVATVSHELRTPLAGVIGTTELLLETKLADEQQEYAEIIRSSSEGLLLVINDILDYSKIEAGML